MNQGFSTDSTENGYCCVGDDVVSGDDELGTQ